MAKNVIIKQKKSKTEVVEIYPQTESNIVVNNSTEIAGNTVTDVFDSALPLTGGKNISINTKDTGVEIAFTGSLAPNVKVQSDPNVSNNPITVSEDKNNTSATYTVSIKDASTTQKGAVQLSDSTSSTSITTAATSNAVRAAYSLASGKQTAFDDGSATIATANGGTITIKAGVSQSGGTISNSSDSDVSTYTKEQIDSLVAGLTKYLGTATAAANLTDASTANAGDFFRVTTPFTVSNWGTAHVGDLVILKKDTVAGDYATITNWEIIHTGDNTSYGVVSTSADGLAPKITTTAGQINDAAKDRVLVSKNGATPKWQTLPANAFKNDNTTYTIGGDGVNKVYLYENGNSTAKNTVIISDVPHASSANSATIAESVANSLTIKLDGGETEGTSKFTYDGSVATTIDVARSVHTHGHITNSGKIVANRPIKDGDKIVITDSNNYITGTSIAFDSTTTTKALTQAGTWESFLQGITINSGTKLDGKTDIIGNIGTLDSSGNNTDKTKPTLGDSGITPGTYSTVTINSKGIAVAGTQVIKYYAWGTTDQFIKDDDNLVSGGFAFVELP